MLRLSIAAPGGRPLIILGLQHSELDRLRAGRIVKISLEDVGLDGDALLLGGEDHLELAARLEQAEMIPEEILAMVARNESGPFRGEWRG